MAVSLRAMDALEFSEFLVTSREEYIGDRVASGDDAVEAARAVDEEIAEMFPDGHPSPGHRFYCVEDNGERVGSLWIGPPSADRPGQWWVWDITIEEAHRGRGFGKAAMLLAEREARSNGATHLGLSVFGYNTVARHLYESLGYHAVSLRMSKEL